MKLALFETKYGKSACPITLEGHDDYIRISEVVDVEFPLLSEATITNAKVKVLDGILEELMTQIERVNSQKQELLSLSHEHE